MNEFKYDLFEKGHKDPGCEAIRLVRKEPPDLAFYRNLKENSKFKSSAANIEWSLDVLTDAYKRKVNSLKWNDE
jgi:hypothetical protein